MATTIRVAAAQRPPYVFVNNQLSGPAAYSGLLVQLLPVLLQTANITAPFEVYTAPDNEGGSYSDGAYTGMLAELIYDRADITLFPLTILESRADVIDFTYSYVDGGIGLLVRSAKPASSALGFLRPFSWQVWIALLATILGVVILMHILARLTPLGNYDLKAVRLASASSSPPQEYIIDPGNSLWVAVLWCCVNSPFLPRGRSWSVRILQLAFGFFCVVVVNTYTASLASLLTVQNLSTPITSLLDLLRAAGPFVVNPNGSTYSYFMSTLDPVAQALVPHILTLDNSDDGEAAVNSGQALAYLSDYSTLQYYQTQLNCRLEVWPIICASLQGHAHTVFLLTVAGDPFGPGNLALGLRKGSPYKAALDRAMITLRSNGFIDVLRRQWLPADYCSNAAAEASQNGVLEISEITGLFYMLMLFMVLAFVWSFGEWCAVWFARRYPETFKRASALAERFWFAEQHHKNVTLSRRFSNVDLPSTLPDRKHHAAKGEEGSAHGGARHSRLGRQVSGRESSSPGPQGEGASPLPSPTNSSQLPMDRASSRNWLLGSFGGSMKRSQDLP